MLFRASNQSSSAMTTSATRVSPPSPSSPASAFRFCLSGRKRSESPICEASRLPTIDAREQRRLAYPQDSSDRDLEYHRFCVSSGRNILSSMAQSAMARFVFANDMPPNTHQIVARPEDAQLASCTEFMLRTTDGELCHSYWLPAHHDPGEDGLGDYSVLYLHGASGNIGHRLEVAKVIRKGLLADVLLVDYRGFGRSSGQPSELGTYLDAQAGLDWILAKHVLDARQPGVARANGLATSRKGRIVVFGTSLGAAIAMHLASQEDNARHLHAVVIENCFTSIAEISRYYVPNWVRPLLDFVKSTLVCPMYDCLGKAARIRCAVLYLVGLRDPVVPSWMSQILYSQTCNAPCKNIYEFPEGRHNDLPCSINYTEAILNFLERKKSMDDIDGELPTLSANGRAWQSGNDMVSDNQALGQSDKMCGRRRDLRAACSMSSLFPLESSRATAAMATMRSSNCDKAMGPDVTLCCSGLDGRGNQAIPGSGNGSGVERAEGGSDPDLPSGVCLPQGRDEDDSSSSTEGSLTPCPCTSPGSTSLQSVGELDGADDVSENKTLTDHPPHDSPSLPTTLSSTTDDEFSVNAFSGLVSSLPDDDQLVAACEAEKQRDVATDVSHHPAIAATTAKGSSARDEMD